MDNLTKALSLYEIGCWVFPARVNSDGTKSPLTEHGHLDASNDPEVIHNWFAEDKPNVVVGVHAGRSGLNVLDRDIKDGKDGFVSLEDNWLIPDQTFSYRSINGNGRHDIYAAPENVILSGRSDYRDFPGVDRRAGSSWFVWAGDEVPSSRDAFAPAPEWLNDPATVRTGDEFEGDLSEWLDTLILGEPNGLVRQAIQRVPDDMSHSEMVERQLNAIRLGAEGNPGVPELLNEIQGKWLSRPEENHSTPRDKWQWKYDEALDRGIRLYGDQVERIKNLPAFNITELTDKLNTSLLVGEPGDKYHFFKVVNDLSTADLDADTKASVLWNAPTTKELARDWGIDYLYEKIESSKDKPEPTRENPHIEELELANRDSVVELLTEKEREYLSTRPTFVDHYMAAAKQSGIDNAVYTRAGAWNVASMAFAFKGFIPQSSEKRMGVNLWTITMGESGTGKTTALEFEEAVKDQLFEGDNEDKAPYHTGADTSPQGLHQHLLERDRLPTCIVQDEASVFFDAIKSKQWISELTRSTADWYNGRVRSSSKLTLKELRGKTALTSFHMSMMGTPGDMLSLMDDSMFTSGFLARVLWDVAPPPTAEEEDRKYVKRQYEDIPDNSFDEASPIVTGLVVDLISAARQVGSSPRPILADHESLKRMERAHKKMGNTIKGHQKWNILEPSVTRLGEDTVRKCAAICAMYRGDTRIRIDDTLHALEAVEIWFNYLLEVVSRISQGAFQKLCNDMEAMIHREKLVTETKILNTFRNRIERDPRELTTALNFLVTSGRVNKDESAGKVAKYEINGG